MENRFKLRISRMFQSSFSSCRTRNISDDVEKAVFTLENHKFPYQSTQSTINHDDCIMNIAPRETHPRLKVSTYTDSNGRKCPPASLMSPLNLFSDCNHFDFYEKKKSLAKNNNNKKKNNKRVHVKCNNVSSNTIFFTSSSHYWFSSSEDDETGTLFSSKTLSSSDTSELFNRRKKNARRRRGGESKVKDSFAVVKSSDDPYNDFRASMAEMIIERQIFGAKELEQLLECFLSLNSRQHQGIIVEAFTEICETLFSNLS